MTFTPDPTGGPITDLQWGIADWDDYVDNWRDKDASYLQARGIARFHSKTDRNAALGTPAPTGAVAYNETTDMLEWQSKNHSAGTASPPDGWLSLVPMPLYMAKTSDSTTSVGLAHSGAGGKGINWTPTEVQVTNTLNVMNNVLRTDATGVSIKTGSKTAKLTTDTANLISDTPLSLPSLTLTGTGTVLNAAGKTVAVGTLNADTAVIPSITMSGTLSGNGIVNGGRGTIGGVKLGVLATDTPTGLGANIAEAPAGFVSQSAKWAGDGTKGLLTFTGKAGQVQVDDRVGLSGAGIDLNTDTSVRNRVINWFDNANTQRGQYAVSVYSATDPGAINFPDGTIWIS